MLMMGCMKHWFICWCLVSTPGNNLIDFIFMKSELFYFYFQNVNLQNYRHHDWPEMLFNSRICCSDSFCLTWITKIKQRCWYFTTSEIFWCSDLTFTPTRPGWPRGPGGPGGPWGRKHLITSFKYNQSLWLFLVSLVQILTGRPGVPSSPGGPGGPKPIAPSGPSATEVPGIPGGPGRPGGPGGPWAPWIITYW